MKSSNLINTLEQMEGENKIEHSHEEVSSCWAETTTKFSWLFFQGDH